MFHLRSPLGQYKLTFDKAREACAQEAATMATYNQLSYAQKVGCQSVGAMQAGSSGCIWWVCHFLLTQGSLWLLPSWKGEFRELPSMSTGGLSCQHRVGASLTLSSILTTSLEVGVPTAILQIGQLRFGKVTCPMSPNQEVADPGLNIPRLHKSAPNHDIQPPRQRH